MFPCLCVSMMFQSLIKLKLKSKVVFIVRYNHLPPNHKKKEKEDDSHCKMFCHSLGWRLFLGNDRSFTRTNGTIKNDPIISKKRTNAYSAFLKILERFVKERYGNCLKRTFEIRNAFLLSRTRSKLGTHFKSGICSWNN